MGLGGWTIILIKTGNTWETEVHPPIGSGLLSSQHKGLTVAAAMGEAKNRVITELKLTLPEPEPTGKAAVQELEGSMVRMMLDLGDDELTASKHVAETLSMALDAAEEHASAIAEPAATVKM